MRFYTKAHGFSCAIDPHARWMYLCILDPQEEGLLHRNPRACLEAFLKAIERYCRDLVVAGVSWSPQISNIGCRREDGR